MAERFLEQLSEGKSLRQICRADPRLPSEATIRLWAAEDRNGFSAQYARARALGLDALADEMLEIADDGTGDVWVDEEGVERTNYDVINRTGCVSTRGSGCSRR